MSGKKIICRLTAILQISTLLLAALPFSFSKANIPQVVFTNPAPISINTASSVSAPIPASVYPSQIDVAGMTGTITNVDVTLKGVTFTQINQLDVLLVSPTGAKFIFLSDVNTGSVEDQVYRFTDSAATGVPNPPTTGTYRPSDVNTGSDTFPSPAPPAPYNLPPAATFASVFNGANPNGAWTLYAVDDTFNVSTAAAGSISSGWSLTVTTDGAPQTFSNTSYIAFNDSLTPASPYGSTINVSGLPGVIVDVNVSLTGLAHTNTPDIDVLLVTPNGSGLVVMSDAGSFSTVSNVNLTFDDEADSNLPPSGPIVSGTFKPTDVGGGFSTADTFPAPAPMRPYSADSSALSNLNGFNPNGDWKLYVIDDGVGNSGSIAGGWSLDITVALPGPPQPNPCAGPSFSTTTYASGNTPTNLVVGDFNNDMDADVAVTNQASNDVSVLLGNGDGTLDAQMNFSAGTGPYAIAAGQFSADANLDLAVANSGSNNVSILLGNGNGTFSAPTNFAVSTSPVSIVAADFTNDGKPDLAVANFGGIFFGTITILIGNGTGGFTATTPVRARTQPSFVTATNFNGDGNQDLIVASFGSNSISTFTGNGNGTFQLRQNINTPAGPIAIETAHLNADSFIDFTVANYNADSYTNCVGASAGTFNCSGSSSAGGANPISIAFGDFTGSGTLSQAIALSGSNAVNVFGANFPVGTFPNAVETADFNEDNKPDLIAANSGSNDLSILINTCTAARGFLHDYSGDRRTDYSIFRPSNVAYFIPPLNSGGIARHFGRPDDTLTPGDYDGDRLADFAYYRPANGLWHVVNQFSKPLYQLQFGLPDDIPAPADFDGDGKTDLALFRPSNGTWYIRRSSDNSLQTTQFGMSGDKPVAFDFDGDDKSELAVYRPSTGTWYIWRSSDAQIETTQFGIAEDRTVAGDYDADGKADIAVWRPSTGVWYVLRSSDGGVRIDPWGTVGDSPVPGDYDGDGRFDHAVWRPGDGNWYVFRSSNGVTTAFTWGLSGDVPVPSTLTR